MKRRTFMKSMGLGGASVYVPSSLTIGSLLNSSNVFAASPNYDAVNYTAPTGRLPQVINIFLYGGPSELAGNLTNIQELETTSQNSYEDNINGITRFQNDANPGLITPNGFWSGAGGDAMEFMINQGYMTVYRTMMKRILDTRSHRQSIFMNQKGNLDTDSSPGMGTRLATVLDRNRGVLDGSAALGGKNLNDLILPFVSFEGETTFYAPDPDNALSFLGLNPVTLDQNFDNPYTRRRNESINADIEALVAKVVDATHSARYDKVDSALVLRERMQGFIDNIQGGSLNDTGGNPPLPNLTALGADAADTAEDVDGGGFLQYPNNNGFTDRIRAAVTLAIENPDSLYITVGGGLGGWDDHNNGRDRYPDRMEDLMNVMRVAMKHIKYSGTQTAGVANTPGSNRTVNINGSNVNIPAMTRATDNIVINIYGDFGRRVNLNGSFGWDHGNCQNLYTFGGEAVRPGGAAALGKVVGTTMRVGQAGTNNQVLEPTSTSYEFEPMSVASSIYSYFGVQNPEIITSDVDMNPDGDPIIDETVAGEATLF